MPAVVQILLVFVVVAALALLLFVYFLAGHVMNPPGTGEEVVAAGQLKLLGKLRDPKTDYGIEYEEAAFSTTDGLTIRGWYVPSTRHSKKAVVAVPGGKSNRKSFLPFLTSWHEAGLNVLLIDPRASGKSDDDQFGMTLGLRESRDVLAAAKWLRSEKSNQRVGAIGISQGGSSVLQAAAGNPDIDAVVLLSTGYDKEHLFAYGMPWLPGPVRALAVRTLLWRHGMSLSSAWALQYPQLEAADKLTQPVLYIQGDSDVVIPLATAETLFKRLRSNSKEFWVIPGLGHSLPIFSEPQESLARVSDFFANNL